MAGVGAGSLIVLFGVVASGAVIPVVPTGAAVSAAAALCDRGDVALLVAVVAFGAAGAYLSDLLTYGVLRAVARRAAGSGRVATWLHGKRQSAALARVHGQLSQHELRTLLLSRLIPGGQIPVLIAAAFGDYAWRRYATADVVAAAMWATLYAATGVAGRAVFPRPWEGVAAGIALVVAVSLAGQAWTHRPHSPPQLHKMV